MPAFLLCRGVTLYAPLSLSVGSCHLLGVYGARYHTGFSIRKLQIDVNNANCWFWMVFFPQCFSRKGTFSVLCHLLWLLLMSHSAQDVVIHLHLLPIWLNFGLLWIVCWVQVCCFFKLTCLLYGIARRSCTFHYIWHWYLGTGEFRWKVIASLALDYSVWICELIVV